MKTRARQEAGNVEAPDEAVAGPSEPQVPTGVLTRSQRRKRPAQEPLKIPDVLPDQRGARKAARKQIDRVTSAQAAPSAPAGVHNRPGPSDTAADLPLPALCPSKEPKTEPEAHTDLSSRARRASARAQPKLEEASAAEPTMVGQLRLIRGPIPAMLWHAGPDKLHGACTGPRCREGSLWQGWTVRECSSNSLSVCCRPASPTHVLCAGKRCRVCFRKLGAGFDDLMPGMASSSQFKVEMI